MSEAVTENKENKRTPYEVNIEPIGFEPDCAMKFLTSLDLCKLANEYFRAAFVDFEGSNFDMSSGFPSISLYFNHNHDHDGEGTRACDRVAAQQSGSTILDRTRGRDLQLKEGDRYHITDDGMDIIIKLLNPRAYNNGKPNWKSIVTDVTDRTPTNIFQPQQARQLTKVVGIDPRNILSLIYGNKDEEGFIDYGIEVKSDLTIRAGLIPGNQTPNYALAITRAYNSNIQKTYEKFGINVAGSTIVRN